MATCKLRDVQGYQAFRLLVDLEPGEPDPPPMRRATIDKLALTVQAVKPNHLPVVYIDSGAITALPSDETVELVSPATSPDTNT